MLLILVFIVHCPLCAVQTHAEKVFTGVGKLKFLEGAKESRGGQVFGGTVKALSCFVGQPKKTRRDTSKAFGKTPPPLDPSLHIVILADCWLWWTYAGTGRELTWWDGQGDKFGKSAPTWDEQGGVRITPPQHVQLLPLLLCWVHLVQNPDVNRNVELVPLIPSCVE